MEFCYGLWILVVPRRDCGKENNNWVSIESLISDSNWKYEFQVKPVLLLPLNPPIGQRIQSCLLIVLFMFPTSTPSWNSNEKKWCHSSLLYLFTREINILCSGNNNNINNIQVQQRAQSERGIRDIVECSWRFPFLASFLAHWPLEPLLLFL